MSIYLIYVSGGTVNDGTSVAQSEVWFPFIAASHQPLVIAWFAFGVLVLATASVWVYLAKRRALGSALAITPRSIRVNSSAEASPVSKTA